MKRLLFIFGLLLVFALNGYSQATAVQDLRVALRTTTFDVNLPSGSSIYCEADSTDWKVTSSGTASTRTITTALANDEIYLDNTDLDSTRTINAVTITSNAGEGKVGTSAVIDSASTLKAGVMTTNLYNEHVALVAGTGIPFSEPPFEVSVDDPAGYQVELTHVPIDSVGITVIVNGNPVTLTTQFYCGELSAKTLTFLAAYPLRKYDKIKVMYTKSL